MIEIYTQIKDGKLIPVSREHADELKAYRQNQLVKCRISGTRKARSVLQNKWVHAMFRYVAHNSRDPKWDTPEKVKHRVKRLMNFFDIIELDGDKIFFRMRSFSFDKMEHNEANVRFEDCKNICAKHLGVDPEILEAEAKKDDIATRP